MKSRITWFILSDTYWSFMYAYPYYHLRGTQIYSFFPERSDLMLSWYIFNPNPDSYLCIMKNPSWKLISQDFPLLITYPTISSPSSASFFKYLVYPPDYSSITGITSDLLSPSYYELVTGYYIFSEKYNSLICSWLCQNSYW